MNRIDFVGVIAAERCNPNGDPVNNNIPRMTYEGYGEISDVCIKRKIRNRLQDIGESIFVEAPERNTSNISLKSKVGSDKVLMDILKKDTEKFKNAVCEKWFDVRAFGQVFANKFGEKEKVGVSIGIRGCTSIWTAHTLEPIDLVSEGFSNSCNREDDGKRDNTTMRERWIIDKGAYIFKGGIYPQLASLTGFTDEDAEKVKYAISTLFEGDWSCARPAGSMGIRLYWFTHNTSSTGHASYSPIQVHRSLNFRPLDYWPYFDAEITPLKCVTLEILGDI